ncbi:pentatricopeptide repeat-containing protein At2g29760, chloroplastic isoform X2 [Phalaenopsis equestris]|uniref:pentatricopeptide repeat-containing protein At2g29760, chloroplastic isoform X2 n=1 Tax=Phalaenopsis equestris TaxID=78828 RepID=UPI0009E49AA5|nr:pentatricopeptide repeat-containing protein At2g29760, chloroplastic isoform X2 [Phalaenopsis equestris]
MATTTIGPLIPVAANPRSQNGSQRFPADHPILSFLDEHNTLTTADLKRIHARMLRFDLLRHPYAASRLLTSFALSPSRNLPYALRLFDQIPHPNLYSWNILIRSLASSPLPYLSLHLFSRMLTSSPHSPDRFTFPFVIKAAAELEMLGEGSALHGLVIKSPFHSDVFILNSLVHFYAVCGCLDLSRQVFDFIPQKDVVSWNSMITALVRADRCNDALELFKAMEQSGFAPNDVTMVSLLSACGKKGNLELGWWMHSYIKQNGIKQCLILNNAILDMYAKCGSSADASLLFNSMKKKDSISWTTMLVAYAKSFEFDAARRVFDEMPHRDTAVWNALISGYEQNGRPKDALAAFNELRDVAKLEPDELTFVAALSACSQLCALESALIDMYSKCGDLENAVEVFRSVNKRDVFVWSSMIAGLAMHGRGMEAMDLFKEMQVAKVKPNHVTFTNILSACSHAGLVEEGRMYFTKMLPLYGIAPQIEHYGCMADILGRAGRLEEARELIKSMPFQPPASAWGALLGACVVHGDVLLGELACHKLLELEPRNDGAYVLLSNLYAKAGRWEDVGRLRKSMRDQGLKKEPGCSSMEVDGVIHEFLVGDASHPLSERIYKKLEEMTERLKAVGYEANRTQLLQNVEDEVGKEHALSLHSEKLAIAYGLISVRETMAIRINKNLRICEDCHSVGKLISDVYGREILIRDRYRFHHFKQGRCSCKDYW